MLVRKQFDVISLLEFAGSDRFALERACREQVQPIYLGDYIALCRLLGRYKFYVDTRDCGFGSNVLLDGFWEMWLTIAMARNVKAGMVAIDVGANFGYYSLLLADLVGPSGRLLAVEPNPSTAVTLRRSLTLNGFDGRTTVVEAAASSSNEGSALLFAPFNEPKNALIVPGPEFVDPTKGSLQNVPRWSLDAEIAEIGRVDFIKIDAEGAEEAILEGMSVSLNRHKPDLVLEYNAARYSGTSSMLTDLLSIYGEMSQIDNFGALIPATPAQVQTEKFGEDWLLYFKRPTKTR